MKLGWLIYEKKDMLDNRPYVDWFIDEAKKQDLDLQLVLREDLQIGIRCGKRFVTCRAKEILPEFAVVRTIDPLLSLHLEALGVHVFNPSSIALMANNKALTHHCIQDLGIPMVTTIYTKRTLLSDVAPLDFPFIMKASGGRGGKEVYWIEDKESWQDILTHDLAQDLIIQETNVQVGKDLRVFIVGKEIIGAVLRSSETDYRANFKLGGSATLYTLNEVEKERIMTIVNHFDFGMVGIDFLISENDELIFNETEDIVGSRTLSAVSDINILEKYVRFMKEEMKLRVTKRG